VISEFYHSTYGCESPSNMTLHYGSPSNMTPQWSVFKK